MGIGSIEGMDFDGTQLVAIDDATPSRQWLLDYVGGSPPTPLSTASTGNGTARSIAIHGPSVAYTANETPASEIWLMDPYTGGTSHVFSPTLLDRMLAIDRASDGDYYGLVWTGAIYRLDMVAQTATLVFHNTFEDWTGVAAIPGVSQGACCLDPETCLVLPQTDCDSQGGTYMGDGTDCDPYPCQQVPARTTTWGRIKRDSARP
jgi:hypothetical protein